MNFFKNLKSDIPSSLVVFLIALPLSLGIALASGAPIKSGLIAAIIGGVIVGLFGGAPFQVSGPAAGLTVMVFGFIQKFGFQATCIITMIAGGLQIALGLLGIGQLTLAISPSVIHAMLAGIGILIALGQTHVLIGSSPKGSAIENIGHIPESIMNMNTNAFLLGALTLFTLWAWNKYLAKKIKVIPGSLIAVGLGTFISYFFALNVPHVSVDASLFNQLEIPHVPFEQFSSLFLAAIAITLVASTESLLCAVATDKLHSGPRAHLNKELIAQGIGNSLSGLLGGLPITGVIVRSSANINAGAKSNWSAVIHGMWIFIFATFFAPYLSAIPLSVLAGLLIYTGVNLVKLHEIKELIKFNESVIYFVTLAGVVLINLLWGIGIGFGLALGLLIYKMSAFKMHIQDDKKGPVQVIITGSLTFLGIPKLTQNLNLITPKKTVQLHFELDHIDHASIEAIKNWKDNYEKTGGKVIKESLTQIWSDLKSDQRLEPQFNLSFTKMEVTQKNDYEL